MEFLTPVAEKIVEYAMEPIVRQFGYLFYYKKNIQSLREEIQKLDDQISGVQQMVDAEGRNSRDPMPLVKSWLEKARSTKEEIGQFLESEPARVNKGCCLNGWCPNPMSRYTVSRKATKKTQDVDKLFEDGKFSQDQIRGPPQPPIFVPTLTETTQLFQDFESRVIIMDKVMEALKKDDGANLIRICGPGGVGKTTMVYKIVNKVRGEKLFDEIAMATVSQKPVLKNIQDAIADQLGLKFEQQSQEGRAAELHKRIVKNKKKFLLVLDDVWDELPFGEIGLPSVVSGSYKILFASRSLGVLLMSCGINISPTNFEVPTLSKEEALRLFKESAGDCCNGPDIVPIAEKVVNECGGLPIAIVTVGSSLRAVGSDKREWSYVLRQLERGKHGDKAQICIKLSYDYLKPEELQRFFLLCCVFPEDADIPIETLVRYGMGIGLLRKFNYSVQDARDQTHSFVRNLRRLFLLIESEKPEHVRMHDVVRDVGLSIGSEDQDYGVMNTCEYYESCEHVSDPTKLNLLWFLGFQPGFTLNYFEGMKNLNIIALPDEFDCYVRRPKLLPFQLHVLENIQTLCLEHINLGFTDLSSIGELRTLEILSFYGSWGVRLPSKLGLLTRLRLLDCTKFGRHSSVKISNGVLSGLKQLENLYLGGNEVEWVMEEEGEEAVAESIDEFRYLSNLTTLSISFTEPHLIDPNGLLHFEKLIKFQIGIGCYIDDKNWEEKNYEFSNRLDIGLKVEEKTKQGMASLINILLKETEILNVYGDEDENVRYLNSDSEAEDNLFDFLQLSLKKGFSGGSPSLSHLQYLDVCGCDSLKYVLPFNIATDFLQLKSLTVRACSMIEEIFHRTAFSKSKVVLELPQLMTLEICGLDNLKSICTSTPQSSNTEPSGSLYTLLPPDWTKQFQNLRVLEVALCPDVEVLFDLEQGKMENATNSILPQLQELSIRGMPKLKNVWKNGAQARQGFQNLQILVVSECENMEHIIGGEGEEEDKEGAVTVLFPQLAELQFKSLQNLVSFFSGNKYTLQWMSMKLLILDDCPNMKTISSGITSHDHLFNEDVGVVELRYLLIENIGCEMIWHCKTHVSVEDMRVSKCHKLKNVLASSYSCGGIKMVKLLDVSECDSLGVAFQIECEVGTDIDANLLCNGLMTELTLKKLPKLNRIWNISSGDPHLTRQLEAALTKQLQKLHLDGCPSLHRVARSVVFPKLCHLDIRNCSKMEEIFGNDDEAKTSTPLLPNLGHLILIGNANLKSICKGMDAENATEFSLQHTIISCCPKLGPSSFYFSLLNHSELQNPTIAIENQEVRVETFGRVYGELFMVIDGVENLMDMLILDGKSTRPGYLSAICSVALKNLLNFPAAAWWHFLQSLPKIEILEISSCGSVEVIFGLDQGLNPKKLPQLTELKLTCLEKLTCIWMKGIPIILSQRFQNLRELYVGECHSLRNLLTLSMVKHLPNLTTLTVVHCSMVEEICVTEGKAVEDEGEEINNETIEFSHVKKLTLVNLPKLTSFCAAQVYAFNWPSLTKVVDYGCPKLDTFTLAVSYTPKLMEVETQSKKYPLMEDLNATAQLIFKEKLHTAYVAPTPRPRYMPRRFGLCAAPAGPSVHYTNQSAQQQPSIDLPELSSTMTLQQPNADL